MRETFSPGALAQAPTRFPAALAQAPTRPAFFGALAQAPTRPAFFGALAQAPTRLHWRRNLVPGSIGAPPEPGDRAPLATLMPALAAYLAAWALIAWPWLAGHVTIPWDAKAEFAPQVQFLAASLARGESPFWNPYSFSGHPQIADPQSLIFSLPYLLLAFVNPAPSLWAIDTTELVAILVGGLATILWFWNRGWHPVGGAVAALAFTFGAAMAWRIQHVGQVLSLVHVPIVLVLLDRALAGRSARWGIAAGLAGALLVMGRDQVALLSVYLLAGYAVDRLMTLRSEHRAGALRPLAAGLLAGLCVVAVPLTLTYLFALRSNRPSIDFLGAAYGSLHPANALTLLVADVFGASGEFGDFWGPPSPVWHDTQLVLAQNMGVLYIGAAPALLLTLGLASGWLWAREIRYLTGAAVFAWLYALGWYTPVFAVLHAHMPGVDLFRRPADAVFMIGFLMAVLAGYCTHRLLRATERPALPAIVFAVCAVLAGFAAVAGVIQHFGHWNTAYWEFEKALIVTAASGLAVAGAFWLHPIRPRLAGVLLIGCLTADFATNDDPNGATGLTPGTYAVLEPVPNNRLIALLDGLIMERHDPTVADRVELVGLGFHWPNASMTHRLESTLGYNPLRSGLYSTAVAAGDAVGLPEDRHFSPLFPSYRSTLANLLGLRFIASSVPIEAIDTRIQPGDLKLITRTMDGIVYENEHTYPRVMFATEAVTADFAAMLKDGHWPAADLSRTVLLEAPPPPGPPRRRGSVAVLTRTNTIVVVAADSPDGGIVVLNDLWDPWWFATLDGAPVPIARANVLFRAVTVPAGPHTLRFEFRPLQGAWRELW